MIAHPLFGFYFMKLHRLFRHRGLGINLLASFCFLLLAVYGWGMSWKELGSYLLVILVLLACVIAVAALCGWLLGKLKRTNRTEYENDYSSSSQSPDSNDKDTKN